MKTRVFMVVFGALAFEVYLLESVVYMRQVIYCLVVTSVKKPFTMKWIDDSLPHKGNRRLKDHKVLKDMAKDNPDIEDIFEDNLIRLYLRDQEIWSL